MGFDVEHELHKRRFGRNMGLGLVLAVFVGLVFGLSVVKVTQISAEKGFGQAVPAAKVPVSRATPEGVTKP